MYMSPAFDLARQPFMKEYGAAVAYDRIRGGVGGGGIPMGWTDDPEAIRRAGEVPAPSLPAARVPHGHSAAQRKNGAEMFNRMAEMNGEEFRAGRDQDVVAYMDSKSDGKRPYVLPMRVQLH